MLCTQCEQDIPEFLFIGDDHPVMLDHPMNIHQTVFPDNPEEAKVTVHAYVSKTQMCSDVAAKTIADRLPADVVYYAAIRLGAHATTGRYSNQVVPDLLFMDAIKRWFDDHEVN